MGQEIAHSEFSRVDYEQFSERLRRETQLLHEWLAAGRLEPDSFRCGYEMEAWLLDQNDRPAPCNDEFLRELDDPLVVPELAQFNFELNGQVRELRGDVFTRMHNELLDTWRRCHLHAREMGLKTIAIGTLPSAEPQDFCPGNMSSLQRYKALNEQVLRMRRGVPIHLQIHGHESLDLRHPDVMLEAATTSFQIHLQMPLSRAVRFYNASKIVSAPLVALSANSPYLFGRDLWAETRIPLFEQAVPVGQSDLTKRVSFGIRYAHETLMEVFDSNLARYPILLPHVMNDAAELMSHLRLHNGTVWRWNRPLLGFDSNNVPHFRLEQRCVPAGPTVRDAIANMAFYYGLVTAMSFADIQPEQQLSFEMAHENFYSCARLGLDARVHWLDGRQQPVRELILQQLLVEAEQGLNHLGINRQDIHYWLGIIQARVSTGRNGSSWQRHWMHTHAGGMTQMVEQYLQRQMTNEPVHLWDAG